MGNALCKSTLPRQDLEENVEEELGKLARRHHTESVNQLVLCREGIQKWQECFLQMEPAWGELEWDQGLHDDRDMRDLIQVECLNDTSQLLPSICLVNGLIIRQRLAHPDMQSEIGNPVILVLLNSPEDLVSDNLASNILEVIRGESPDVVITPVKTGGQFVDFLRDAGVSLVSEVDGDTISRLKMIMVDSEHVRLEEETEYLIGSGGRFFVKEANNGCEKSTLSQDMPSGYEMPCCAIEMSKPVLKTVLLSCREFPDITALSETAHTLMLSLCWKFLETSFLADYFRCQDDLFLFREFIFEVDNHISLDMPINVYSLIGSSKYSLGERDYSEDLTSHLAFQATTFCFNPDKQFYCESPHSHCVEMYSSKDLSILEYMIEASPRDIKCSHSDCGYDACIHKRTFVANNAAITVSSTHMQIDNKDDDDIYIWIEHGGSIGTLKRKLSITSRLLSITHLLRLMLCSKFSHPKSSFESKSFCMKKNGVVMTFSLKLVEPFKFTFPSKGNNRMEKELGATWMLGELEHLQDSLALLEHSKNSEDISSAEAEHRLIELLRKGIEDLRERFVSGICQTRMSPQMYLELDSVHYLHRLVFALLTNEEHVMDKLGSKRFLSLYDSKSSSSVSPVEEGNPCVGPHLDAGEYDIDRSDAKVNAFDSKILREIVELMQNISLRSRNVCFAKLENNVELSVPENFLWDGEHWCFLRGDFHCSVISCFLSSRIYANFVQQTVEAHGAPRPFTDWKKVVAIGSAATCKISVGNTVFESFRAVQFHALRENNVEGGNDAFLASLRNCKQWSSSGGKSNVYFAKSMDDRYIIKEITPSEKASFVEFAGDYFEHTVSTETPCLAKILGMFKVSHPFTKDKRETLDLVVVENVFYGVAPEEAYDLKGLPRILDRLDLVDIQQKVLVDGNLRSKIRANPLFVHLQSLDCLSTRMKIDTGFLSNMNVMDYSLLIGINRKDREIRVGIIDYLRGYTLDKHIESWVKLLRRPGEDPTIISPQQYAMRFQEQILAYFTSVPLN